jgi:predicted phosphoribosyltransferase
MFRNREEAARQLAQKLKRRKLHDPLVLAVPRGGLVTGAILAQELGAELDIVLARKVFAPGAEGRVLGAVDGDGQFYLNPSLEGVPEQVQGETRALCRQPLADVALQQRLYRSVRPAAALEGRSVIVTDDGIATGSTMLAAVRSVQAQDPLEVIVAVPVSPARQRDRLLLWCDDLVWLLSPEEFEALDEFYEGLPPVSDEEALPLLREAVAARCRSIRATRPPPAKR